MNALVWEAPRVMNLRQQPEPTTKPDEVLVKVSYGGICGSELSGYLGHNALRKPPLVMGHEFSGTIAEIGSAAAQQFPKFQTGQEVTVNPIVFCGECEYCHSNLEHLCPKRGVIGAHRPGAYADYVAVPANLVHVLPSTLDLRSAALTEPVGVAVRIANLIGDMQGQTVLIAGAGPIGLLTLQMVKLRGAQNTFITDLSPERRAMAEKLGGIVLDPKVVDVVQTIRQATDGRGAVATVDAVGVFATRQQCVSATRSNGTMILSGLHEEVGQMPAAEIIRREINVKGSFAYSHRDFDEGLQLLADGKIHLDPWIVEAPLAEGGHWFDRLVDGEGSVAKVLLVP
ncbi:MAG: alcohol dehydrogenase catalytic domain-containing protein [Caldilineaceae bacterium]